MTSEKGARTLYRIVARSELGERYEAAFDGMRMETRNGETVLTGEIVDQAHLFGVLDRVNALGLRLLSVQLLPDDAHPNAEGGRGPKGPHPKHGCGPLGPRVPASEHPLYRPGHLLHRGLLGERPPRAGLHRPDGHGRVQVLRPHEGLR